MVKTRWFLADLFDASEWRRLRTIGEVARRRIAIEQALRWTVRSIRELRERRCHRRLAGNAQSARCDRERRREEESARGRRRISFQTRNLTRNTQSHASGRATRYEPFECRCERRRVMCIEKRASHAGLACVILFLVAIFQPFGECKFVFTEAIF